MEWNEYLSVSYMWCKETHTDISFNLDICEKGSYFILRYNRGSCARYWLGTGIHTFTCKHAHARTHTHTHTHSKNHTALCVKVNFYYTSSEIQFASRFSVQSRGPKKNVFFCKIFMKTGNAQHSQHESLLSSLL